MTAFASDDEQRPDAMPIVLLDGLARILTGRADRPSNDGRLSKGCRPNAFAERSHPVLLAHALNNYKPSTVIVGKVLILP